MIPLKNIEVITLALAACVSTTVAQTLLLKDDFSGPKLTGWTPSMAIRISQSNQQYIATSTFRVAMQTNNPNQQSQRNRRRWVPSDPNFRSPAG